MNGSLIVTSSGLAISLRDAIIAETMKHRLPTLYYSRAFITSGGLLSYGSDRFEQFRQAAGYVDRILKGEKPADGASETKEETMSTFTIASLQRLYYSTDCASRCYAGLTVLSELLKLVHPPAASPRRTM